MNIPLSLSFEENLKKVQSWIENPSNESDSISSPSENLENIKKGLDGLEKSLLLEQLPTVLSLLEDQSFYSHIFPLIKAVSNTNFEQVIEVIAKASTNPSIKTQCLACLKDLIEQSEPKNLKKVIQNILKMINDNDKETAQLARIISNKIKDSIPQPLKPPKTELVFGIIPHSLFSEFLNTIDKKQKTDALKSIEKTFCGIKDVNELLFYQSDILQFISQLLNDSYKEVVNIALKILIRLSESDDFKLSSLNTILFIKLGDSSIHIRQTAFKVLLRNLIKFEISAEELLPNLESENWHIREETINIFIAGLLLDVNFFDVDLILYLSKLLDDQKGKIRQVAIEAFAVIAKKQGKKGLESKIKPLVDEIALKTIINRIEFQEIASLENNLIVFPKIIPSSAPSEFSTQGSYSPFPCLDKPSNFSIRAVVSPVARSSSEKFKKPTNPPFKKNSEFLKPPLPIGKNKLPAISKQKQKTSFFDKTYTEWTLLEPLSNPLEKLGIFESIIEENWEVQFECTNVIRKLVKFHKDLLNPLIVHKMMMELVKWGDSLRSSLSKNSILALGESCKEIPKMVDSDADPVLTLLLRKSVDTNSFISETAVESLLLCVNSCNLNRIAQSLLVNMSSAKSGALKSKIALCCKHVRAI